ncbi:MAG: sigma-54-dependent Fis family transcriptional regulator [Acidobacteria bacterium]|nr:MAG: sigma-54-dependent Fis family transcriptional regulator [Acidobacteriota bacterium]
MSRTVQEEADLSSPGSILVIDDEPHMLRYMRTLLEVDSYRVETLSSGLAALDRLQKGPLPDLVLLDVVMPDLDGLQTLERLHEMRPELKVVMLSCVSDPRTVVQAIRLGAQDYLPKPFHEAELEAVIRRTLGVPSQRIVPTAAAVEAEEVGEDIFFVAASEAMHRIRSQVGMVARVDVPVLVLGESGTGKEVVARLVHKLSPRANNVFLKVNCAALPSELLESELFGYEAGAFTGASKPKPGKFELCNKGTILLDEIGEMPPSLQAKLLHVLQDQQFSRLGSRTMVKVDVRILAATNINIQQAIASKKLREDLYYRLNAFTVLVPPLRERSEEIPLLLRHFMSRFAARYGREPLSLPPAMIDKAMIYPWPGNLRELENFVKRYLILGDEAQLLKELECQEGGGDPATQNSTNPAAARTGDLKALVRGLKDEAEIKAIGKTLERTRWNRKEAARLLNISYKALLYKIRQYGLEKL